MPSLLLGCGHDRRKKVYQSEDSPEWNAPLVRLDMNPRVEPDVLHDLEVLPLPFPDNLFDQMGAYDVLEHFGRQGDWRRWFDEFAEYHRVLKPGGLFGIIVPIGADAIADPGHTRFIGPNHFAFLNQQWYADQLREGRPVTDYRFYWKLNFDVLYMNSEGGHHLSVLLRKA